MSFVSVSFNARVVRVDRMIDEVEAKIASLCQEQMFLEYDYASTKRYIKRNKIVESDILSELELLIYANEISLRSYRRYKRSLLIRRKILVNKINNKRKFIESGRFLRLYDNNLYNFNVLNDEECDRINVIVDPVLLKPVPPKERVKFIFSSDISERVPIKECTYVRSSILIDKIHDLINSFRSFRLPGCFKPKFSLKTVYDNYRINNSMIKTKLSHQMEEPSSHGEDNASLDIKSNVVLTETRQVSEEIATLSSIDWTDYCSSEIDSSFKNITDRWLPIDTFEWNANLQPKEYNLPYDIIVSKKFKAANVPNCAPFMFHRYWKGDMEIKIHVNSNKFQIGSLQCAWLYQCDYDDFLQLRKNVYSLSQAPHVIVNASSSNEATLYVPYKNHLPLIHTKTRSDMPAPLHAGRLFINVINPLTVSTNGPTSCYVTVFVRFVNSVFTGMLDGSIDALEHQMDRFLTSALSTGMRMLQGDENRDNPPMPGPPSYLVPTASHSWSYGTGVSEPLHALRLDGRGQTPHPAGIHRFGEMDIKEIANIFGLIGTVEWSKDNDSDTSLFSCDAAPLLSVNKYPNMKPVKPTDLFRYYVPPIAVLSSMFMGWRGTIEFRFDFVASSFHTGRLICGYIPGATEKTQITNNILRSSTNVVFTLQEQDQFSFMIPYIANKPFWFRTQSGDYAPEDALSPSRLYLRVLNRLVPMESVPPKVFINIYMRAGPDFELIVPVQPAIGLGFDPSYIASSDKPTIIRALSSYYPYYSGSFEDFDFAQVFRWGTASHQIAKFMGQNYYDDKTKIISYCVLDKIQENFVYYTNVERKYVQFAVFVYISQLGYIVGIPCISEQAAKTASCAIFRDKKAVNDSSLNRYFVNNSFSTTQNGYCTGNPDWTVRTASCDAIYFEGERDVATGTVSVGTLRSTNSGQFLYGEAFSSLKDLTRRYQNYGTVIISKIDVTNLEKVQFSFPILPQGLNLNLLLGEKNIDQLANRCREGHIPIIASGYRYYRGGIRFRLVMDPKLGVGIGIQHRPDRRIKDASISYNSSQVDGASIINHSYSSYLQLTSVNGVVEFEVPYYLFSMYGLLQRPRITQTDETNYFSLGDITVNLIVDPSESKSITNSMVNIFYSMADDMHFSTFQGFPPVVFCNTIPPAIKKPIESSYEVLQHQMFSWVTNKLNNHMQSQVTNIIHNSIRQETNQYMNVLDECIKKYDSALHDTYLKIGLELLHMVAESCSIKSISFGLIKILLELKFIALTNITQLISVMSISLRSWLGSSSNEVLTDESELPDTLRHQNLVESFDPKTWIPLLGMLYVGTSTALNMSAPTPTNMSKLSTLLIKNLPTSLRGGSFLVSFLFSIIDIVKNFVTYIIKKVHPIESWYYDMNLNLPDVQKWADEVLYLESIDLEYNLISDGYLYDRIYYCYIMGRKLLLKNLEVSSKDSHLIIKLIEKSKNVYDKMLGLGKHPFIRREPFSVWMCGKPGIGKSFLTEFVTSHMLRAIKYELNGPKMFTIMPLGEFWTGCKNQPVLNMDDAFSIDTAQAQEKDLNIIYMVKSPVALNPPMANLEDKHLRYNPEIFWINSNKDFARGNFNETAIARRSDIRIRAEVVDPMKPLASQYTPAERSSFSHLRFFIADIPAESTTSWSGPYTMTQLLEILLVQYKEFYLQEIKNYEFRLSTYDIVSRKHMTHDEIEHQQSLRALCQDEYESKRLKYRKDVRDSLYYKAKEWGGSLYTSTKDNIEHFLNSLRHENGEDNYATFVDQFMGVIENIDDIYEHVVYLDDWREQLNIEIIALDKFVMKNDKYDTYTKKLIKNYKNFILFNEEIYSWDLTSKDSFKSEVHDCAKRVKQDKHNKIYNDRCSSKFSLSDSLARCESANWFKPHPMYHQNGDEKKLIPPPNDPDTANLIEAFDKTTTLVIPNEEVVVDVPVKKVTVPVVPAVASTSKDYVGVSHILTHTEPEPIAVAPVLYPTVIIDNVVPTIEITAASNDSINLPRTEIYTKEDFIKVFGSSKMYNMYKYLVKIQENVSGKFRITDEILKKYYNRHSITAEVAFSITNSMISEDVVDALVLHNVPEDFYITFLFGLKNIYKECKHIELLYRWEQHDKKWYCDDHVFSLADGRCGDNCIRNEYVFWQLFHDYNVRRDPRSAIHHDEKNYEYLPSFYTPNVMIRLKDKLAALFKKIGEKVLNFMKSLKPIGKLFLEALGYLGGFIIGSLSMYFGIVGLAHLCGFDLGVFGKFAADVASFFSGKIMGATAAVGVHMAMSDNPVPFVVPAQVTPSVCVAEGAYNLPQKVLKAPAVPVAHLKPQSSQNYKNALKRLSRNYCIITCSYIDENMIMRSIRARYLGIGQNIILGLQHYHESFMAAPDNATYKITLYGVNVTNAELLTLRYKELRFAYFDQPKEGYSSSYYLLYLPPSVPLFPNIVGMFADAKSLSYTSAECDLFEFGTALHSDIPISVKHDVFIEGRAPQRSSMLHTCYAYGKAGAGMCGSVLLDKRFQSMIIGMHVGGGSKYGVADTLCKEMFKGVFDKLEVVDVELPVVDDPVEMVEIATGEKEFQATKSLVNLEACLMKYGTVRPQMAHRETGKSQLQESLLHGVFPIRTEPNPLKSNDKRLEEKISPMKAGCEKHGKPVKDFPKQFLETAGADVLDLLITKCRPVRDRVGVLSLEEAICGCPYIDHFESLDWNTSPGYGFVHLRPTGETGKKWLFTLEEREQGYGLRDIHPALVEVMQHKLSLREQGIVPCTVFIDCLKDTTIPVEKCKIPGKTRIFSISPVDFTIQFKQFFNDFLAAYTEARFDVESAIGINVMSSEWTDLALLLNSHSPHIVSGDYSNFGPGLNMEVAHMVFTIIEKWYEHYGAAENHLQIIRVMKYEVLNSYHLCFNLIYQVFSGIPSGSPITAPLNNLVNCCYIRIVWLHIFKNTIYQPLLNYRKKVKTVCYGDDIIMSVSDDVIEKFNCKSISEIFSLYNIKFTNFDKTDKIIKYDQLTRVSFLSGEFIPHPQRPLTYLYGLKKISIEGCVNWVRVKNQSLRAATLVNCHNALRYAFGWGPTYYCFIGEIIKRNLAQRKIEFLYPSWREMDEIIFELKQDVFQLPYFIDFD